MSQTAAPYYPSMYYYVSGSGTSPYNGVYGAPVLSNSNLTATYTVTVTASSTAGSYNMYAYGRDNPSGLICFGDSYNFTNSPTVALVINSSTPSAPTITGITAGSGQLSVAFTAGSNGGSAITNYKYSTDGGSTFTAVSPASTASPIVITGLTNGTTYSVQIKAVNANGDGAASATSTGTLGVAPAITSGTRTSFTVNKAGTFTVTDTGSPTPTLSIAGTLPSGVTFTPSTGILAGTPAQGTVGSYTLTFTAANGIGTNATQSFTLTVGQAGTSITLSASSMAPAYGLSVTFTATVALSAAIGTVTFEDGTTTLGTGTLSGGTATFNTSALAIGRHSITAVYGGNGIYASSTSAAVTVVVSARPDPTQDPAVQGTIYAQVMAAQRLTKVQINNVSEHLLQLHAGFDLKSDQLNVKLNAPGLDQLMMATRELVDGYDSIPDTQGVPSLPDIRPTLNDLLFGGMPLGLWASGNVDVGSESFQANSTNRFSTSGITIGLDYKVRETLIVGTAVGYGNDSTDIDGNGSLTNSDQKSATAYASYQPIKDWFVDAILGYGSLSYTNQRWVSTDSTLVSGDRSGYTWYGSLSVSDNLAMEKFMLQPYLRADFLSTRLKGYSEQGSTIYALSYDGTDVNSRSAAVGVVSSYDIQLASGTLTPSAKAQYMHTYNHNINQGMFYSDIGPSGGYYLLSMSTMPQNMESLGAGIAYKRRNGLSTGLTYTETEGSSSYRSHAIKAEVRVGF
ncbi:MAG: autotransporter domain-containing protein [Sulfuricaulis sp.]